MVGKPCWQLALFLLFLAVLIDRQSVYADCRSFSDLIRNGAYAVADQDGSIADSCNEDIPFIPASIVKVPLALAAFDILGADFRFTTELYMDGQENLYIHGSGDPFLVSEEVGLILDRLAERGVRRINGIFVDNSRYDLGGQVPGRGVSDNPYDVPVNATAVNFNTVSVRVLDDGNVVSAEPQTPTLPVMKDLARSYRPGEYRLNVCPGNCSADTMAVRYTAELFRAMQRREGIEGDGPLTVGNVPESASLVYLHRNTKTLEEVVVSMLEFSSNFIANQLFLRCGVEESGWPANWDKAGTTVAASLARRLGRDTTEDIRLVEGSGLSRGNRVTARAMTHVLREFRPHASLLRERKHAMMKSGTLDGVYNYAGYLADGRSFVILLNQRENTRDNVLKRLNRRE